MESSEVTPAQFPVENMKTPSASYTTGWNLCDRCYIFDTPIYKNCIDNWLKVKDSTEIMVSDFDKYF